MNTQKVIFIITTTIAVLAVAAYLSSRSDGPGYNDVITISSGRNDAAGEDVSNMLLPGKPLSGDTEAVREYRQGKVFLDSGDIARGREHLERAVALDPEYAEAYNDLGVSYARQGFHDRAIMEYETALRYNPEYVEACYNLGVSYNALGRTDEAIARFVDTLHLDENFPRAHNNLGGLYALAGDFDLAITHLEAAIRINPDFADAHQNLANIYEYLGDTEKATNHAQIAETLKTK